MKKETEAKKKKAKKKAPARRAKTAAMGKPPEKKSAGKRKPARAAKAKKRRVPKKRALISVFNKDGAVKLAQALVELGYEVVSSGGTARALTAADVACKTVEDVTGFPEILGGRVKTLHPKIHGGILARHTESDLADLAAKRIKRIQIVCVNLYPFTQVLKDPKADHAKIIENIDIGGVALLRAAAKNCDEGTVVICDPADYDRVIHELQMYNAVSDDLRKELAQKAFECTTLYDAAICQYFAKQNGVNLTILAFKGFHTLRKGESDFQSPAVLCQDLLAEPNPLAWSNWEFVANNPGYVNLCGGDNALRVMCRLAQACRCNFSGLKVPVPMIGIASKHGSPCGLGVDWRSGVKALERTMPGDKDAVMGAEVMVNFAVGGEEAIRIHSILSELREDAGRAMWGTDVVFAPSFSKGAKSLLTTREVPRHLLANPALVNPVWPLEQFTIRPAIGGGIIQPAPNFVLEKAIIDEWLGPKSTISLSRNELMTLLIAWVAAWEGPSNSSALAKNLGLIGTGFGQQCRRGTTKLTINRAWDAGHDPEGSWWAEDGFFPRFEPRPGSNQPEAVQMLKDAGCLGGVVPADGKFWPGVRQYLIESGMRVAAVNSAFRGFIKH